MDVVKFRKCDVVYRDEILSEAINALEHGHIQEKNIQLLTLFVKKLNEEENYSKDDERWLERISFCYCFKCFVVYNNDKNAKSLRSCSQLFQLCCTKKDILLKSLHICVNVIQDFLSSSRQNLEYEDSPELSLNIVVYILGTVYRSPIQKAGDADIETLQENVFSLCMKLLESDFLSQVEFTSVNRLITGLVGSGDERHLKVSECFYVDFLFIYVK